MKVTIRVGVFDWTEFPSDKGFYPPDLPAEWRFGFFSNEFEAACIDLSRVDVEADEFLAWVDDMPDSFKLCFLANQVSELELLRTLDTQSDVQIDSVLTGSDNDVFLQQLSFSRLPCFKIGSIWSPEHVAMSSGMAWMPARQTTRDYRNWVDQWLESYSGSDEELILWLPGTETTYAELTNIKTLVELMGY